MEIDILWQDKNAMVINKPNGIVVNRAESVGAKTIQDWVENREEWQKFDDVLFNKRSGIAHRLDKETSGCLVIAKNPQMLLNLLKQFKDRKVKKEYLALVHGHLHPAMGTIRLPLRRSRFDREKFEIHYEGKQAETGWNVEKYFYTELGDLCLVRLFPLTGRTHQIRVHLAHLGHPVFADDKYLPKNFRIRDREKLGYHFLHAEKISFLNGEGESVTVSAPLPKDASKLLSWIENE